MDSIEQLCKTFRDKLDNFIKTDSQITVVDLAEFNKASDVFELYFRTVTYKGQYFTIEWWATETGMEWHLLCEGVTTEEDIDAIFDESVYIITAQAINSETEINENIFKAITGIRTCCLASNMASLNNIVKHLENAINNMSGQPNVNKFMLSRLLRHYKLIN
jgi:hypothetical protein